ncbi:hypothetical protein HDV00_003008 [Rhizophlyctis rosea]|nr:hypothetical protein HDV00_003008 [Rhizophlyctis rosea]
MVTCSHASVVECFVLTKFASSDSFAGTRLPPYQITSLFRRPLPPTANASGGDDGYPLWRATGGDMGSVILKFYSAVERKEANAERAEFAALKRLQAGQRGASAEWAIARFYGAKEASPHPYIFHVFEECSCTLEEYLGNVHKEFNWSQPSHRGSIFQQVKQACEDVVSALIHCHENDIVYGEIKTHSVWGTQTRRGYTWKLADFSTSYRKHEVISVESTFITPERALVLRRLRDKTDSATDVREAIANEPMDAFALGCWLIEVFTRTPPSFKRLNRPDQVEVLTGPGIVAVPEGMHEMVGRLLIKNERARMTVEQFKDSSFWTPKSPASPPPTARMTINASIPTGDANGTLTNGDKLAPSLSGLSLEAQNRMPNLTHMDGTMPYLLSIRDVQIPSLFILLPNYEMPRGMQGANTTSLHLICEFDRQQHIVPVGYPLSGTDIIDAGLAAYALASLKTVLESAGDAGYHFVRQGRGASAPTIRISNKDLKQDCEDVVLRLITRGRSGQEDTLRIAARALMWLKRTFI